MAFHPSNIGERHSAPIHLHLTMLPFIRDNKSIFRMVHLDKRSEAAFDLPRLCMELHLKGDDTRWCFDDEINLSFGFSPPVLRLNPTFQQLCTDVILKKHPIWFFVPGFCNDVPKPGINEVEFRLFHNLLSFVGKIGVHPYDEVALLHGIEVFFNGSE